MVRPRKAGLFQTDSCLAREVRTGQERVSGMRRLPFDFAQDNFRDAEIAVSAVLALRFWWRKTLPKKFSTAKTVKTAETLDTDGVNLLFGGCRAECSSYAPRGVAIL